MNLLRFNFNYNPQFIFINNSDLFEFLDLFNENEEIQLIQFYGINSKVPVDENEFEKTILLKDFIKNIKQYEDLLIYNLVFKVGDIQVDIMDSYEYNISTTNSDLTELLNNITKQIVKSELRHKDLLNQEDVYLLFDNGQIIKSFPSFDDYINYHKTSEN